VEAPSCVARRRKSDAVGRSAASVSPNKALNILLLQFLFLFIGMLIPSIVNRVRNVVPHSMALAFGMYALSVLGGTIGDVKLEVITPLKHFEANHILSCAAYDQPLLLISLSFIIYSVVGKQLFITRRNPFSGVRMRSNEYILTRTESQF
jgi:hypothetical protein